MVALLASWLVAAACGGSQPQSSGTVPPALRGSADASDYRLLYSFGKRPDAEYPTANLIDVHGMLYGTAGGGALCQVRGGCGTVFRISTAGKERVLYSFRGSPDGAGPSGLIDVRGTLYGTTVSGGTGCSFGCGTVFSIDTSGNERVLHSFSYASDGVYPDASLTEVNGSLYGTTEFGGMYGLGTVFSVSTSGAERVLYNFHGADGAFPAARLIDVNGALYGTTTTTCFLHKCNGAGTVFSISTTGNERTLYYFHGRFDGAQPYASLIDFKGMLYGTTQVGGTSNNGTVFSITTSGNERVLYSFGGSPDGAWPLAGLIAAHNRLYGTTNAGGTFSNCRKGCGTLFSLDTSGNERLLHSFGDAQDGAWPYASLTFVNGVFYGTASGGGMNGFGTVFALAR